MRKRSIILSLFFSVVFFFHFGSPFVFATIQDNVKDVQVDQDFGGDVVGTDRVSGRQRGAGAGGTFGDDLGAVFGPLFGQDPGEWGPGRETTPIQDHGQQDPHAPLLDSPYPGNWINNRGDVPVEVRFIDKDGAATVIPEFRPGLSTGVPLGTVEISVQPVGEGNVNVEIENSEFDTVLEVDTPGTFDNPEPQPVQPSDTPQAPEPPAEPRTLRHPDGTTSTQYPDGKILTQFPDGRQVVQFPDGKVADLRPDGTTVIVNPDGSTVIDKGNRRPAPTQSRNG